MSYYLAIVGALDNPLYEAHLSSARTSSATPVPGAPTALSLLGKSSLSYAEDESTTGSGAAGSGGSASLRASTHACELVAHASLDTLDDAALRHGAMYMKQIDRFAQWHVSAWLTSGGVRIVLLHDVRNDEGIRLFLQDTWELYTRTLLNPFYELHTPIKSAMFDSRVRASARRHL